MNTLLKDIDKYATTVLESIYPVIDLYDLEFENQKWREMDSVAYRAASKYVRDKSFPSRMIYDNVLEKILLTTSYMGVAYIISISPTFVDWHPSVCVKIEKVLGYTKINGNLSSICWGSTSDMLYGALIINLIRKYRYDEYIVLPQSAQDYINKIPSDLPELILKPISMRDPWTILVLLIVLGKEELIVSNSKYNYSFDPGMDAVVYSNEFPIMSGMSYVGRSFIMHLRGCSDVIYYTPKERDETDKDTGVISD